MHPPISVLDSPTVLSMKRVLFIVKLSPKTYTAEALPSVIAYLREQGYTFKNFYEIFK